MYNQPIHYYYYYFVYCYYFKNYNIWYNISTVIKLINILLEMKTNGTKRYLGRWKFEKLKFF